MFVMSCLGDQPPAVFWLKSIVFTRPSWCLKKTNNFGFQQLDPFPTHSNSEGPKRLKATGFSCCCSASSGGSSSCFCVFQTFSLLLLLQARIHGLSLSLSSWAFGVGRLSITDAWVGV